MNDGAASPLGFPGTAPSPRSREQARDQDRDQKRDQDRDQARVNTQDKTRRDSTGGEILRLGADDATRYLGHLLRLSRDDRRLRFAHQAPDRMIERSVARIDWASTALFGWVVEGAIRGVAHLAWPDLSWLEGAAELAVSVETGWQRQGVGTALVAEAMAEARRRDLPAVRFFALAENTGIVSLMQRFGATNTRSGGEIDGRVDLPVDSLRLPGLNRRSRLGRRNRSFRMSGAVERLNLVPNVG